MMKISSTGPLSSSYDPCPCMKAAMFRECATRRFSRSLYPLTPYAHRVAYTGSALKRREFSKPMLRGDCISSGEEDEDR